MTADYTFQDDCATAIEGGYAQGFRKQLIVVPTGGGKTVIFAGRAKHRCKLGKRTLILAHRKELVEQAMDKLASRGVASEKEKADAWASLNAMVVVGSVQTMTGQRLQRWPKDHFDLVIPDEAHHSISDSWQETLNWFDAHANVLGVTATPDRGDKKNLGTYYDNIAYEIGLFDLIHRGCLSPITIKAVPLAIDISRVGQDKGDFDASGLSDALEPYLGAIAAAIREHASFRRTLAFLPLIRTSKMFVEACRAEGINAVHVDGESPDREEITARAARGEYDLISNAMLWTEGYDNPLIDCVVNLRPTRVRALYSQIVGRGTRIHPLKENLLLLDFLWAHQKHSLVRPAHLVAKTEQEAEVITKLAEEKQRGGEQQCLELEGLASEASEQRHEALRKQLEANSKKKAKHISAEEWCMSHGAADIADYEPSMKWESQPMTEKQAKCLKRAGIDLATVSGKGHAIKLLDKVFGGMKLTAASDAQKQLMKRAGNPNWQTATAEDARQFFNQLRKAA
jgi:superfamily II DNA or RNA helicase